MTQLIQTLPDGNLDIVGDVHGEWHALSSLLKNLGYCEETGSHPEGRHLVFVGDLCDRGPDSPAILAWLAKVMPNGNVFAVLGNHEMNLLLDMPKDGSGWYFSSRDEYDDALYAPWEKVKIADERKKIHEQLLSWPLVLERDDIRIVHAAWFNDAIEKIRSGQKDNLLTTFKHYDQVFYQEVQKQDWYEQYLIEKEQYKEAMLNPQAELPLLSAYGQYESMRSQFNPISAITTGVEAPVEQAFYSGGRWRFSSRLPWWESYDDNIPVVFGHYWRAWQTFTEEEKPTKKGLFVEQGDEWLGKRKTAFCVDFSIGARWRDRKMQIEPEKSAYRLAALRWPERVLVFDDGSIETTGCNAQ